MDLFAQAKARGIQTEFLDGQGHRRVTDAAALKIILDALPPQIQGPLVGRPVVVRAGGPARTELRPAARLPVRWKIVADAGVVAEGEASDRVIDWPEGLPSGVYRLQLTDAAAITEDVPLISAPERAFGGDFDRCWLLAVQLYGVRSPRNWGIGDFTDLVRLIERRNISAPTASASIRCMPCSTIVPAIAAPIRRTAGCFSMRSISTSKSSLSFTAMPRPEMRWRRCGRAT